MTRKLLVVILNYRVTDLTIDCLGLSCLKFRAFPE